MKQVLPLNLQFFAEDNTNSSAEVNNTDNQVETQANEHMIPKSRFDEVNRKYKEMQDQFSTFQTEKQEAERKAQEESGQFKELYESTNKEFEGFKGEFNSVKERNEVLEGVVGELYNAKLKSIPSQFHDLVPEHLPIESKLSWITKAEEKGLFGKGTQQPLGEQTNGSSNAGITKQDFENMDYKEKANLFRTNPSLFKQLEK